MNRYIERVDGGKLHGSSNKIRFKRIEKIPVRYKSIPELCRGKKVIDIGCAGIVETLDLDLDDFIKAGKHQFTNIHNLAEECIGVDINERAINVLKDKGYNAICLDVMNQNHEIMSEKFDTLVCSHVLEHIPDMYSFLKEIVKKFNFDEIIIAVPSAYSKTLLTSILFRNTEIISDDHFYTFTPVTLSMLLKQIGIEVEHLYFDIEEVPVRFGSRRRFLGLCYSIVNNIFFTNKGDLIAIGKKVAKVNNVQNCEVNI